MERDDTLKNDGKETDAQVTVGITDWLRKYVKCIVVGGKVYTLEDMQK